MNKIDSFIKLSYNDMLHEIIDFIYYQTYGRNINDEMKNEYFLYIKYLETVLLEDKNLKMNKIILGYIHQHKYDKNKLKGTQKADNLGRLMFQNLCVCLYYCLVKQNKIKINHNMYNINQFSALCNNFKNEYVFYSKHSRDNNTSYYPLKHNSICKADMTEKYSLIHYSNLCIIALNLNITSICTILQITSSIIDGKYNKYQIGSYQTIKTCRRRAIFQGLFNKRPIRKTTSNIDIDTNTDTHTDELNNDIDELSNNTSNDITDNDIDDDFNIDLSILDY